MTVEILTGENYITAVLKGELDHCTAAGAREIIDARLEKYTPRLCILDFSGVSFMDSSGIGLILGRQRVASVFGGSVRVKNPSRYAEKIIKLAGLEKMILPENCKV
ncbi:MAG TPA: anti-anti-sigma factor [Ruminococcaceae bacterium]|nr:anti-anti-sigma factor [Oscillospiraceae bacterium]